MSHGRGVKLAGDVSSVWKGILYDYESFSSANFLTELSVVFLWAYVGSRYEILDDSNYFSLFSFLAFEQVTWIWWTQSARLKLLPLLNPVYEGTMVPAPGLYLSQGIMLIHWKTWPVCGTSFANQHGMLRINRYIRSRTLFLLLFFLLNCYWIEFGLLANSLSPHDVTHRFSNKRYGDIFVGTRNTWPRMSL